VLATKPKGDFMPEKRIWCYDENVIYELLTNGAIESVTHYAILRNRDSWRGLGVPIGMNENRALSYLRLLFPDGVVLPETLPVAIMPQLGKCRISCYPEVDVSWSLIQRIVNLDARDLVLELYSDAEPSTHRPFLPQITAEATRQVEMILWGRYLTMDMFFSMIDKWRPLLSFILSSCPNLEKVTVCLPTAMNFLSGNDDVFIFLNSLDALLHWVILGVLPMLPKSAVFSAKVEYQVPGYISDVFVDTLHDHVTNRGFLVTRGEGSILKMRFKSDERFQIDADIRAIM